MDRPAEVSDLELSSEAQQQILRLNIAMDHLFLVAVQKSICNLLHKLHTDTHSSKQLHTLRIIQC